MPGQIFILFLFLRMFSILWCFYFITFFVAKSEQNQAPYFYPPLESTYFFPESNQTKVGDVLLQLAAIDSDDTELEFGIISEFYNKLLEIKHVDGKHADVILKQIFDREVCLFYFFISLFVFFHKKKKNFTSGSRKIRKYCFLCERPAW